MRTAEVQPSGQHALTSHAGMWQGGAGWLGGRGWLVDCSTWLAGWLVASLPPACQPRRIFMLSAESACASWPAPNVHPQLTLKPLNPHHSPPCPKQSGRCPRCCASWPASTPSTPLPAAPPWPPSRPRWTWRHRSGRSTCGAGLRARQPPRCVCERRVGGAGGVRYALFRGAGWPVVGCPGGQGGELKGWCCAAGPPDFHPPTPGAHASLPLLLPLHYPCCRSSQRTAAGRRGTTGMQAWGARPPRRCAPGCATCGSSATRSVGGRVVECVGVCWLPRTSSWEDCQLCYFCHHWCGCLRWANQGGTNLGFGQELAWDAKKALCKAVTPNPDPQPNHDCRLWACYPRTARPPWTAPCCRPLTCSQRLLTST